MMRTLAIMALVVAVVSAVPASAQDASAPSCPIEQAKLATEDAGVVAVGEWEIEFGLGQTRATRAWPKSGDDESRGGHLRDTGGSLDITTGLIPRLDIGVGLGWANVHDGSATPDEDSGLTDLSFGLKYLLYENADRRLAFAVGAGATVPLDRDTEQRALGLTQDYFSFDSFTAVTKDFGERWSASADLGFSLPLGEHRAEARGVVTADAALGYQVAGWLKPEVELNYEHEFLSGESEAEAYYGTAGLIITPRSGLLIGVGVQRALAGRNTDKSTSVFMTLKWCFGGEE